MNVADRLNAALAGRYEIVRELGAGGMSTVYLARDVRHDRYVALKVLKPELGAVLGAERFAKEIALTAGLQHPHILPLFDSGQVDGLIYYVMPHVEGETLRDRLTRERELPVAEAVEITRALVSALDYAHRKGVIHRDIKPENILFQDGQPVVADFGIALAVSAASTSRLTESGLSLGTPLYMSPEQLTGERMLDARSDVYALACVAYEMLAGAPPFAGPSVQAIIAAVMTQDAPPLGERRRTAPAGVASAIHRGLERIPADRFATAADFGAALTSGPSTPAPRRASARRTSIFVALIGVAGLALGLLARPYLAAGAHSPVRRWNIDMTPGASVALAGLTQMPSWYIAIALAPAGDHLAYVAPRGGTTALMVRALDGDSAVALPGTDGAYHPFYSPDGAWIGFFAGNLLRKVSATGGNPITVAQVDRITGALWATNDRIFVLENEGFDLHTISASGASAESTVHLNTQFGISDLLPGGQWAIGQLGSGQLALLSLSSGIEVAVTRRGVVPLDSVRQTDLLFGTSPHLLPNGYLIYGTGDGFLTAMPFDGERRRVLGESVPLLKGMRMEAGFGYADFAISRDGTLVYVQGNNQFYVNIAFVSPSGRIDTLPFQRGPYTQPRVSPDGKRLAVQQRNPVGGWSLLLMDLATGARQVVDVQGNYRAFPASWLPSGRELMIGIWDPVQFVNYGARIQSMETGKWTEIRLKGASYMTVSPDGKSFVYSDWRTGDLYIRKMGSDTSRIRVPARGIAASFSPDGRWLAWSGVDGAVAASPMPPTGAIIQVAEHGVMPVWTPRGDGIVYRMGNRYYQVSVSTTGGFHVGRPRLLVEGPFLSTFAWNHAMSPDGRLLVLLCSPEREARTLSVITGFPTMVERSVVSKPR